MKKICILAPVHIYDDIRVFRKEAKTLVQNGYDVTLFARINKKKTVDGIKIKPVRYKNRIERFMKLPLIFLKAIKTNADLYHIHNPDTLPIGLFLKLFGKTVVYDTHEDFEKKILIRDWIPNLLKKPIAKSVSFFEMLAGLLFDKVIITQEELESRISNTIILENPPIIDKDFINEVFSNSQNIIKENNILRLIYIGSISESRGLFKMMEIVKNLNKKMESRLWLIGPKNIYIDKAKNLKGWKYVDYLGGLPQEKAFSYLIKSDFGMITLLDKGDFSQTNPNKIFEYMTFGIPFIATDFNKWINDLANVNAGLFINIDKTDKISELILKVYNDNDVYCNMSGNGKKYIFNEYNWNIEKTKLLKLYSELL